MPKHLGSYWSAGDGFLSIVTVKLRLSNICDESFFAAVSCGQPVISEPHLSRSSTPILINILSLITQPHFSHLKMHGLPVVMPISF